MVHALHQLYYIAATTAAGKAMPEIFWAINDESLWIISVMNGTGADQALTTLFQRSDQAPGGQHPLDGDEALEVGKS